MMMGRQGIYICLFLFISFYWTLGSFLDWFGLDLVWIWTWLGLDFLLWFPHTWDRVPFPTCVQASALPRHLSSPFFIFLGLGFFPPAHSCWGHETFGRLTVYSSPLSVHWFCVLTSLCTHWLVVPLQLHCSCTPLCCTHCRALLPSPNLRRFPDMYYSTHTTYVLPMYTILHRLALPWHCLSLPLHA